MTSASTWQGMSILMNLSIMGLVLLLSFVLDDVAGPFPSEQHPSHQTVITQRGLHCDPSVPAVLSVGGSPLSCSTTGPVVLLNPGTAVPGASSAAGWSTAHAEGPTRARWGLRKQPGSSGGREQKDRGADSPPPDTPHAHRPSSSASTRTRVSQPNAP